MGRLNDLRHQKSFATVDLVFSTLAAGAKLVATLSATNQYRVMRSMVVGSTPLEHNYHPSSLSRATNTLLRRGFVEVVETDQGHIVRISEKGKKHVLKYDLATYGIAKQEPWDEKWRIVFFDIPKGEERARKALREQLKNLGFYQMQFSVYVHPYPCFKEIAYLREIYAIPHMVKLATVEKLENDEDLRKHFKLSLNQIV